MKILQFCKKFPYPVKDGETVGIHNLTQSFHKLGHEVTVLAITTPKHFFNPEELPENMKEQATYHGVFVDTKVKPWPAFKHLFTKKSYNIERFHHKDVTAKLIELLKAETFDVIQLEGLFLAPYVKTIREYSKAPVIMRSQNVEFEIWERLAQGEKQLIKKWYYGHLARRMQRFEVEHLNIYDAVAPVSEKDEEFFKTLGCNLPIFTVITGVDTFKLIADRSNIEFPSVFHLGSMDWLPNVEAVDWFLEDIWPEFQKNNPDVPFYIVGRHTPPELMELKAPGVEVVGEVDSAVDFMNSKSIMVVPLRSGSGMRVKIMEALALGKVIITTSVGVEGIDMVDGESGLIANNKAEFIEALEKCVKNPDLCQKLSDGALKLAKERYDNVALADQLLTYYQPLIEQRQ